MKSLENDRYFSDKMPKGYEKRPVRDQKRFLDRGEYPSHYVGPSLEQSLEDALTSLYDPIYDEIPQGFEYLNPKPLTDANIKGLYGFSVLYLKKGKDSSEIKHRTSITPRSGNLRGKKIYVIAVDGEYLLFIDGTKIDNNKLRVNPGEIKQKDIVRQTTDAYSDYLRAN